MSQQAFGTHAPETAMVNAVERTEEGSPMQSLASAMDGLRAVGAAVPADAPTIRPSSFPLLAIARRYELDPSTVYCYADGMHPRFGDQGLGRGCWHLDAIEEVGRIFMPVGEGHNTRVPGRFHDFHEEVCEVIRRLS